MNNNLVQNFHSDNNNLSSKIKNSHKGNNKVLQIAEILGLLEEKHRGKDWILHEIKKHHLKVSVKPTQNNYEILKKCPSSFVSNVLRILKGEDFEDFVEDLNSLTKMYHWFFTDIVASANPKIATKDQIRKIVVLQALITRTNTFQQRDKSTLLLPTGDGMAIGFADSPERPLHLAIELHEAISKYNKSKRGKDKLLLRIGIDQGPIYFIKDITGKDNFWGPGIITARRVMDLAGDMQIFASHRIAEDVSMLSPEYKEMFHPIGDYSIKHGEQLKIYNIYGDNFGNKIAPRKSKIIKRKASQEELLGVSSFEYTYIAIELNVLDPKTMLTHHKWTWNVKNISKEPKEEIFYYLDGDVKRDFADMNVRVTDEEKNELEITSLSVNKPYHKEFTVQLNKPIKPHQRNRFVTMEYDWEEPERYFLYKLASKCSHFKYIFTIPRGIEVKNRILKVDTEMGYKWHVSPAPSIKYLPKVTEITWESKNLKAHDAYKFEW